MTQATHRFLFTVRRSFRLLVGLLLFALAGGGCVHLEQEIHVETDGSGRFFYRYSVPADTVELLKSGQSGIEGLQQNLSLGPGTQANWFFDSRAVARHFSGRRFRLESYRTYADADRQYAEIHVSSTDARRALATGAFGPFVLEPGADGEMRFRAELVESPDSPLSAPALESMTALSQGLRLKLTVTVPGTILRHTAAVAGTRRAEWVFDADRDRGFLQKSPAIELVYATGDGTGP